MSGRPNHVQIETKAPNLVRVSDRHGYIRPATFATDAEATEFAKEQASELGCGWGENEPDAELPLFLRQQAE